MYDKQNISIPSPGFAFRLWGQEIVRVTDNNDEEWLPENNNFVYQVSPECDRERCDIG